MAKSDKRDDKAKESERVLKRVADESEVVGTSSFVRTANRARDHFIAADSDQNDPAEVWAKRVARVLSVIFFIGLSYWLINFLSR